MNTDYQPSIEIEEPEPGRKVFSIELPETALDAAMEVEFKDLKNRVRVPGFRKGKAPHSVIVSKFGETVRTDALEKLISRTIWDTLSKHDITPFFDPELDNLKAPPGEPVRFRVSVDVWPEFELKKCEDFKLHYRPREITDEDMDREIRLIQEHNVEFVPVEREATRGDKVSFSYQRYLPDGNAYGKAVEESDLLLGQEESTEELRGAVEKALIGATAGDEKSVPVDFPEDHPQKDLASKSIEFRMKVKEIQEKKLPVLDDAFATRIAGEELTLDQLRERVREQIRKRAEQEEDEALDNRILDHLIRENTFDIPDRLIHRLSDQNMPEFPPEDQIPADQREEAARVKAEQIQQHRVGARKAIQKLAILSEISKREGLEPEEREVGAMKRVFQPRSDPSLSANERKEKDEEMDREIRRILRERKVYQWVKDHSTVTGQGEQD